MAPMDRAAAEGRLALQRCDECGARLYPPRELCPACLSASLSWDIADHLEGELLAATELCHSHDVAWRSRLPVRVALVRLDAGPTVLCFAPLATPGRVRVCCALDAERRAVLSAEPAG